MSDGTAFRAQATRLFRVVGVLLAFGVATAAGVGWWLDGWIGLAIGGGVAAVFAACVYAGAGVLWAMSQDGA
ncbi:hypothetical protein [Limnoglobus roseus]|uniref:Uncharacterized protein n=1 Tax=Limnoglobus roseus TaxID=2598579 RepID=A0A5C1ARX8_9BACT|nr:hypothetical protein [Limnoglobus roseus]QEL20907.1 hypothetical protein PX52LOC_08029 [Limnoglobus roseus]